MQELRRITLTEEELKFALDSYRRINKNFLPAGEIVECKPLGEDQFAISVVRADTSLRADIQFKLPFLYKPLVRYCIENNITLPVGGQKSVSLDNGSITLQIILRMDDTVSDDFSNMSAGNL